MARKRKMMFFCSWCPITTILLRVNFLKNLMAEDKIIYSPEGESSWTIPGVVYRGETGTYRLFERMNPNMAQDVLAELTETEKQKGNPHAMDSILHFAIFSAAHKLKDAIPKEAESLRMFLRESLQQWSSTLSRVRYTSKGNDEIIHNYHTSDQYILTANVVGPDSETNKIQDSRTLYAFLGTSNVSHIDDVFQWLNHTSGFLWREDQRPAQNVEQVIRWVAYDVGAFLDCDSYPSNRGPSLRVLRVD